MTVKIKAENRAVTSYYRYKSLSDIGGSSGRLSGPWRVIVFCIVTILIPILFLVAPLYIRYEYYKDVIYNLGESDLVTVDKPISTFWCEGQDLWMNATFHAYLLEEQPNISENLQHFEMDKHMQLADDSLEYWGFFLLHGSKVTLSVCSRFDGRLMVVKGTKNLKHCALLDPDPNADQIDPWEDDVSAQKGEKIEVTFEQGEHKMVRGGGNGNGIGNMISARQEGVRQTTSTTTPIPVLTKMPERKPDTTTMAPTKSSHMKETMTQNLKKNEGQGEMPTAMPKPSSIPEKKTSGKVRIRGRKPVSVTQEDSETLHMGIKNATSTKDVRPIHENIRVQRHKSHPGLSHPHSKNRKRRLITSPTDTQMYYDDESEQREETNQPDPRTSEEHDLPPNPVGVEPEKMTVQNHANLARDFSTVDEDNKDEPHPDDQIIDAQDIRSSGSSFAKNLWTCYGGDVIFTQSFSPSQRCQSQDAMMRHAVRMKTVHEITSTGYYYYIFYSDNDIKTNDIFARFDIEKVVYHFPNYTSSCLNSTQCSLDLSFLSSEKVLLEVPLQDGVSDEDALAQMVLVSTCRPRLGVYFIFPVAILIFILCCAFI